MRGRRLFDRAGQFGLLAAWSGGLGICLLSITAIYQAGRLQVRVDEAEAVAAAEAALHEPLLARSAGDAHRTVQELMRRPEFRFKYLAVRDGDGVVLAASGVYDHLNLPLSTVLLQRLRELLYAATSRHGQERWTRNGRTLGTLEYAVSDTVLRRIRDEAVARLWWFGVIGLLLGAPMVIGTTLALRRGAPAPSAWINRLETPTDAAESAAVPAESQEMFRQRAGSALDQLGRALLMVDREAHVRYMNPAAESLTGWSAADATGRLVYSVFHPLNAKDEPMLTPAEACLHEATTYPATECRLRARDGTLRPIEAMAARLTDAAGTLDGAVMFFHDISGRQAVSAALARSSRLTQGVIDHLVEGVVTTDPSGVVHFANARALRMFGYAREDLEGVTITKLMPVPFLNSPGIKLTDYIAAKHGPKLPKVVGWRKDATTFPVELMVEPMRLEEGEEGLVVVVRDITDRLRSENLTLRLGRLLDNAAEEVFIFDAQSLYFLEVNRGAQRNLGYRPDQLSRMTPLSISAGLDPETFQDYLARLRGGELDHLVYRCAHQRADGSTYPVEVRLNFSRDEEPPVFMAIAANISERQANEERLQFLAHHDALTGLPNRAVLNDRLQQAVLQSTRTGRGVAVLFLDLDRFKRINDTMGHEAGDAVLRLSSERLQDALRASDTVARLGGDEFVVVAGGMRDVQDAELLAQKLLARFTPPFEVSGRMLDLKASIGVTVYPYDDADPETLLQHADTAMYEAKQAGRAAYRMYRPELSPERSRHLMLARDIYGALAMSQLEPLFQPVVDVGSGTLRLVTADFRWRHPRHGLIGSAETLEVARGTNLSSELELWLLGAVCQDYPRAAAGALPVMVPFSSWQFRDATLRDRMTDLFQRCPSQASALVLGMSEEGLAEAREAVTLVSFLRDRGARFCGREIGSGFAALNRLGQTPVAFITLAERLVAAVPRDAEAAALVRTIVSTAMGLHLPVVAGGVAGTESRSFLESIGCTLMAGPLLHGPLTADELSGYLSTKSVKPL